MDTKAGGNKEVLDTIVEGEAKQKHKDKENGSNKKNENENKKNMNKKDKKVKKEKYSKPKRSPTEEEIENLFGKALELLIVVTLKNHVYQFKNQVRVQKNGGPIGLKLTGEVADCIMVEWDTKLLNELKKVNIEPFVYTRIKDDINEIRALVTNVSWCLPQNCPDLNILQHTAILFFSKMKSVRIIIF